SACADNRVLVGGRRHVGDNRAGLSDRLCAWDRRCVSRHAFALFDPSARTGDQQLVRDPDHAVLSALHSSVWHRRGVQSGLWRHQCLFSDRAEYHRRALERRRPVLERGALHGLHSLRDVPPRAVSGRVPDHAHRFADRFLHLLRFGARGRNHLVGLGRGPQHRACRRALRAGADVCLDRRRHRCRARSEHAGVDDRKPHARALRAPMSLTQTGLAQGPARGPFAASTKIMWTRWAIVLGLLLLWEIAARLGGNANLIAPPSSIVQALFTQILPDGEIRGAIALALLEVCVAYALSIAGGLALGLAIGSTD